MRAAVAAGLPGHDRSLAVLPEEVIALLDAHAMMERERNDDVTATVGPQTAHPTTFEQLRGIGDIQPHPKRKLN